MSSVFAGYVLASPAPAHATNTGPFTQEIWVNPNTSIASKTIVGKAEELRLATDASEYPTCQFKATTWQTAATGTTVITLNNWTHLACTYDKTTLRLYANGIQVATQSLSSTPDDTANVWRLGQDDSSSTPYTNLNGTVDNFQFYNYARTPKQIIEDMNGGKSALTPPLLVIGSLMKVRGLSQTTVGAERVVLMKHLLIRQVQQLQHRVELIVGNKGRHYGLMVAMILL